MLKKALSRATFFFKTVNLFFNKYESSKEHLFIKQLKNIFHHSIN